MAPKAAKKASAKKSLGFATNSAKPDGFETNGRRTPNHPPVLMHENDLRTFS